MARKPKSVQRFLTLAADQAAKTSRRGDGGPFGAVVTTQSGRLLSIASNSVLKSADPTCHAEINAIRLACRKIRSPFLNGCVVYSTTEPCPMCFSALHWARARLVVYATTIGDVQKLGFNELSISNTKMKALGKSPLKIVRVRNGACEDLLRKWSSVADRQTY